MKIILSSLIFRQTFTSTVVPKPTVTTNRPASTTKSQAEIDEEESFQLALAISQSEAEEKERQKKILTQKYAMSSFLSAPSDSQPAPQPPPSTSTTVKSDGNSEYAELTKYIERGRQEQTNVSNGHNHESIVVVPNVNRSTQSNVRRFSPSYFRMKPINL